MLKINRAVNNEHSRDCLVVGAENVTIKEVKKIRQDKILNLEYNSLNI
jgi:hypothetical protein